MLTSRNSVILEENPVNKSNGNIFKHYVSPVRLPV